MSKSDRHDYTIHLATDHAGFLLKEEVKAWLTKEAFEVIDHGAAWLEENDDFPDFIAKAACAVSQKSASNRAVIFGGSGQGEAMVANRYENVRATVFYGGDESIIKLSRQHNDANVLSIGARFVGPDQAKRVIWDWLHEDFLTDEKYARRNRKIENLTKEV